MKILAASLAVVLSVGCEKLQKAEEGSESSAKSDETQSGSLAVETSSDLALSQSISPEVPASVTAKGGGEASSGSLSVEYLVGPKKSAEACYIRQKTKEAKMNIESVAMRLCYLEAQKGIKLGKKYKMDLPTMAMLKLQDMGGMGGMGGAGTPTGDMMSGGTPTGDMTNGGGMAGPGATPDAGAAGPGASGPGAGGDMEMPDMPKTMSVFMDNSVSGKLTVFICQDDKLTEKYNVDKSSKDSGRGSFKMKMGDGKTMDVRMTGVYDNAGKEGDRSKVATDMSFMMKMGGTSMYHRSSMVMDVSKKSISQVKIASESSMSMTDFSNAQKEIGTALIGPNYGSALLQRTYDGSSNPSILGGAALTNMSQNIETSRSYFDNAGNVVDAKATPNFSEGGMLYVDPKSLPKLLPESFDVTFDSGDWDCSGTESYEMDTSNDAFAACDERFAASFSDETCSDPAYGAGFAAEAPVIVNERAEDVPNFESLDTLSTAPELDEAATPEGGAEEETLEEDTE